MEAVDQTTATIRRLKRLGYQPAGQDKFGEYLRKEGTLVYVDHIGIFVYRQSPGAMNTKWNRESGHIFDAIPWERL